MPRKPTTVITVISKITQHVGSQAAALVVIHGEGLGRKYEIASDGLIIGRSSRCDVQVDQSSVSRHHAKLNVEASRITVGDMGSTNGTIVNDTRIESPHVLSNGDLIKVGRTIFKFIASDNIEASYHDEIYRMTTVDGLTQVFNRRYLEDAMDRELSRSRRYARPLSLVLLDIDHFKHINDTWGHLGGDAVLKEFALTVRASTRKEDVFARYGGEEFALLLPELDYKGAIQLAEKARRLVEKHPFSYDGEAIPVTMSAGAATLEQNEHPRQLIDRADQKLYEAKSAGRNRVAP